MLRRAHTDKNIFHHLSYQEVGILFPRIGPPVGGRGRIYMTHKKYVIQQYNTNYCYVALFKRNVKVFCLSILSYI